MLVHSAGGLVYCAEHAASAKGRSDGARAKVDMSSGQLWSVTYDPIRLIKLVPDANGIMPLLAQAV